MSIFEKRQEEHIYSFEKIRCYNDSEVKSVIEELSSNKKIISNIIQFLLPKDLTGIKRNLAAVVAQNKIKSILSSVKSVDDFQKKIIADIAIPQILEKSINNFTYSGVDKLNPESRYVFMGNHRDIVLDPALFQYVLMKSDMHTTAIAFGSNLGSNPIVSDVLRCTKGFIVRRNLPMKEQIEAYKEMSAYIKSLLDIKTSIWIAARDGRAKDGNDKSNPAVVKMLYLAHRKSDFSFTEYINFCKIVPVAISYEFDPCAEMKARETLALKKSVKYQKEPGEDYKSMLLGINGYKGDVHLSIGVPIKVKGIINEFIKHDGAIAAEIDNFVFSNYKLFPSNFIAYDILNKTTKFSHKYDNQKKDEFLSLYCSCDKEIFEEILIQYANPVKNKISVLGKHI